MNHWLILVAFGTLVGVFSGLMGLGGGAVMIPAMVLVFGLTQPQAHGTSLAAMLLPVALPAVMKYYAEGKVDLRMSGLMAVGILLGSYFGAKLATAINPSALKLTFGFVLVYVAGYTVFSYFGKERTVMAAGMASVLAGVAAVLFGIVMWRVGTPAVAEKPAEAVQSEIPGDATR